MYMQKKLFNKYTVVGVTDVGKVRKHNEDSILIDEDLGLLVVADGMGGHQAGEVASLAAIDVVKRMLQLQQKGSVQQTWLGRLFGLFGKGSLDINEKQMALEKALLEANKHVYQLNIERDEINGTGMGTTIAGCWMLTVDAMLVFHIGDSRIYQVRGGQLKALSSDHSMYQEWLDNGKEGDAPPANVIVKAIGPYEEVEPEIRIVKFQNADGFLICSDGLTDLVEDLEMERILQGLAGQSVAACQALLDAALAKGGKDNVSIILVGQDDK